MNRIKTVIPMDDYRLQVYMENGEMVLLDFRDRLNTARFGILADISFFRKAATDGIVISWQGKLELSITEVLQFGKDA
jgi:hypothetical protein